MIDIENTDDAIARVGDLAAEAARLAAEPGTAIIPAGADQAAIVKAGMVEKRAALLRQKQEVERATAEAKALIEQQMKDLQRKLAEQQALLAPAMKQLKLLEDGVDAMNIYLGRDEEIIVVREGERAPESETICVRQQVLSMAEESLIAVDKDGMDFQHIDAFVDWLARSDENLDQIIPETKAVVAIIPRRAEKKYADPWKAMEADRLNAQTWWVIRNGESVWLTTTQFTVGNTTVPSAKDFTDLFVKKGRFGDPDRKLEPGSPEWVKAEETADARTRHYMKVALLLQGLLDRTTVFHPHPGVSFLDQAHYDQGLVRVILDGENQLTDGRLPFKEWRKERVAQMHPGMRVIGAFAQRMRTLNSRDYPADVRPTGSTPDNNVPYTVRATSRSYYDWEFSFERGNIFDQKTWEYRPAKKKATGYLHNTSDWWLPLDTITEDEIRYYLTARSQRDGGYLDMIPALRAALEVKTAEREAEAPFRTALIDALTRETDAEGVDTEALADDLIRWYKTANQVHRALTEDESKAAKLILTEARRRARGEDKDTGTVATLLAVHPDAMVVARRSSDFVVAVPEVSEFPARDKVFTRLFFYTPAGKLKETREWTALTRAQVARWSVLHQTDTWDDWPFNPDMRQHYTDDELRHVARHITGHAPGTFRIVVSPNKEGERAHGKAMISDGDEIRSLIFGVDRVKGDMVVRVGWNNARKVDMRGDREPYWETQYWGDPNKNAVIYSDDAGLTAATAMLEAARTEYQESRARSDRAMVEFMKIEHAWEDEELERMKARFVEDFGDISLWEGHLKTIKKPVYPHRWKGDTAFREAVKTLIERNVEFDFAGLTVRDVLTAAGADVSSVDESLLHLIPHPKKDDNA